MATETAHHPVGTSSKHLTKYGARWDGKRCRILFPFSELSAHLVELIRTATVEAEGDSAGVAATVEATLRAGRHLPRRLEEVRHWLPREILLQVRSLWLKLGSRMFLTVDK